MANGSYTKFKASEEEPTEASEQQGGLFRRRAGDEPHKNWRDSRVGRAISRPEGESTGTWGDLGRFLNLGVAVVNPAAGALLHAFGALKGSGTQSGDPNANRIKPGSGGAYKVSDIELQKIEDEIDARGWNPTSHAAEQYRKESVEFAIQTGRGADPVGDAEEALGIKGALHASEAPASMGQAIAQNSTVWLGRKQYFVDRSHEGNTYLIPMRED